MQARRNITRRDSDITGHAYHAGVATHAVFRIIPIEMVVFVLGAHTTFVAGLE